MSRKNKILRAFLHQTQSPTIEQAWDTAWEHAQKTFHARSMQDMEERLDAAQAECERLAEALEEIRSRSAMNLAMHPNPFELTAMLGDIHQIATDALAAYHKGSES